MPYARESDSGQIESCFTSVDIYASLATSPATPPPRIDAFALFLHAVGQPSVNILQMGIIIPLFFDLYAPLARLML